MSHVTDSRYKILLTNTTTIVLANREAVLSFRVKSKSILADTFSPGAVPVLAADGAGGHAKAGCVFHVIVETGTCLWGGAKSVNAVLAEEIVKLNKINLNI